MDTIKFVDLFAGIGGIRKGFEYACNERNIASECVFTSEIKQSAIDVLKQNHPDETVSGDITKINSSDIPDFDIMLAGFPCQAFSSAGKRRGFEDARGTLFFEVARILRDKKPFGFILENVEGLVTHDRNSKKDKVGMTLTFMLDVLCTLGYKTNWRVLNASDFGIPQDRKRVYIIGTKDEAPSLDGFEVERSCLREVLEHGLPLRESEFTKKLLAHYTVDQLYGKSIKDKRGGENNIHSWDIEYRGKLSKRQKLLMNRLLKERRKKKWAEEFGIDWMDGMPLTYEQISSFCGYDGLCDDLDELTRKGYLVKEHPKKLENGVRIQDESLPIGYNIVTGKLSFEVNKVLDPDDIAPTLVAMDMSGLFVVDGCGIRNLTLREGLRLFGYPDDFKFNVAAEKGYDLLGNTVVVPVIKAVAGRLLDVYERGKRL